MKDTGIEKILVMGVGNILLGDEGVGVHSIEYLKNRELPVHADLLDGGTGGFHLLSLVNDYHKMVIIDAAVDESQPGTVRVIKPKFANDFPKALTTHDIGLKDLIETAAALEQLPEIYLVVITINPDQPVRITLSEEIEKALPNVHNAVISSLLKLKKNKAQKV
jgi:hydrogenase maturation protease